MLGAIGVFLCGAPFRGTPFLRAPHSPFLQKPQVCGKWSALAQKRGFRTRS